MISERSTEIFLEAKTLDPEQWEAYLQQACYGDEAMRKEVESLLAASDGAEAYFDKLSSKLSISTLASDEVTLDGSVVIGAWRLLEQIGRGGMGAVYLAERADDQYEHRAALKILPMGLNSPQGRARFLVERQILAKLKHDNIARLLDGGVTDDGLPYFVMDYVKGQSIDAYCDSHQLSTRERLFLVLDVAKAVQYAHRNLVIHRDLKPDNVLVDDRGQVRLLDFGVAKMLQPEESAEHLTQEIQRPATPAFASPEMLRGETVDATTDVYSIGALCYLLLSSEVPLDYSGLSLSELFARASETEPRPLGDFDAAMAGDLEAVIGKALAKQPEDRYESVQSLADDIRNYLKGLPVEAKVPSASYRARKFVLRHRIAVAFSAAFIIALASIAGLATRTAIITERQSQQIAQERDRAEQIKDFLISIFDSADPNVMPGQLTAREILELGRARIEEELAAQPATQADLLQAMSSVYQSWRMATEGRQVLERELELRELVSGKSSLEYAETLISLAFINEISGDYESSFDQASQALEISQSRGDDLGRARASERIGRILHLRGDLPNATRYFEQSLQGFTAQLGPEAPEVALLNEHLANLHIHKEEYEQALELFARSLEIRRGYAQGDNSDISSIFLGMGSALKNLDRLDEATASYERGLAINARLFGTDNSYAMYFENGLGTVAERRGDYDKAVRHYMDSRRLLLQHMPDSPNLGFANAGVGKMYMQLERCRDALPFLYSARDIFESKLPQHYALGEIKWQLGACLARDGDLLEARELIDQGIATLEQHWGSEHALTQAAYTAKGLLPPLTDSLRP